jgi:hypothetical protein
LPSARGAAIGGRSGHDRVGVHVEQLDAPASRSRIGPEHPHGPHQGAQKSTMTGTVRERVRTAVSKVDSVMSAVAAGMGKMYFRARVRAVGEAICRNLDFSALVCTIYEPRGRALATYKERIPVICLCNPADVVRRAATHQPMYQAEMLP